VDFFVNHVRDQSHKEMVWRELVTCTVTGMGLRPAAKKHELSQPRAPGQLSGSCAKCGAGGCLGGRTQHWKPRGDPASEGLRGQEEDRLREACSAV